MSTELLELFTDNRSWAAETEGREVRLRDVEPAYERALAALRLRRAAGAGA